jgi:hypothetical protein
MNIAIVKGITVALVKPEQVGMLWGQVETILESGEEYFRGYYKPDHIFNAVKSGQMQLWIGHTSWKIQIIMLTQLDFYPEGIALRFVYMGGEVGSLKQVMHLFSKVELWGVEHGANKAMVIGRDGWVKKLARYGYQKRSVMLTKDLIHTFGQQWSM